MHKPKTRVDWAALALCSQGCPVVGLKDNGGPRCIHFSSLSQLRQALDSHDLVAKAWIVSLPRALCIAKSVTLPAAHPAEAARMLDFEITSLVPLAADQIVYGCTVSVRTPNSVTLAVDIVRVSVLEQWLGPLKEAGIRPRRIIADAVALAASTEQASSAPAECTPWNGEAISCTDLSQTCKVALGGLHVASASAAPYADLVCASSSYERRRKTLLRNRVTVCVLGVLVVAAGWTPLAAWNLRTERDLQRMREHLAPFEKVVGDVEAKRLIVAAIDRQFTVRGRLIEAIQDLSEFTPKTVSFSSLGFEVSRGRMVVDLRGRAQSTETVLDVPAALQKSRRLGRTQLVNMGSEETQRDGTSSVLFNLRCETAER